MIRSVVVVIALAGCDVVFKTDHVPIPTSPVSCDPAENDEDRDGLPDRCDNCPITPNPGQGDTGESTPDGVGDLCDPAPLKSGDRLIAMFPFVDPIEATRWMIVDGNWAVHDGAYYNTGQTETEFHQVWFELPHLDNFFFEAEIIIDAASPNASVSLLADFDLADGAVHQCALDQLALQASPGGAISNPTTIIPAAMLTMKMSVRDQVVSCEVNDLVLSSTQRMPLESTLFALESRACSLHVNHIVFYDLAGEP